jgi:hypothetical protein
MGTLGLDLRYGARQLIWSPGSPLTDPATFLG